MKNILIIAALILTFSAFSFAQLPRESNGAMVQQTVGDTKITITYHRPSVKGRPIWGSLVPYGQVWRTGANDNTTFEVSRDVTINGQALAAGKYGFHTIPEKDQWTIIFNKVNNEWGSFKYDQKNDALRVKVAPMANSVMQEAFVFNFDSVSNRSTNVSFSWDKLKVGFTVDVGDVFGRTLEILRTNIANRKADDFRPFGQAANYVLTFKVKESYEEALVWLNTSIAAKEGYGNLNAKARLLYEMGKTKEAIEIGERAVTVGKAATPPVDTEEFETTLKEWKAKGMEKTMKSGRLTKTRGKNNE